MLSMRTETEQMDVDFDVFAGAGPSAHAVVARNPADGGNHRFVLSQLPEALALDERDQEVASECCDASGGSLLVCLSPSIPQTDVEPLALGLVAWHKELKPAGDITVVFRDSAFADDVAKTNLAAILHQHGLETVRSL